MSYGTPIAEVFRQVGVYTGSILKGAAPADLPVVQSTKFELIVNVQTARLLSLDIPPTLFALALAKALAECGCIPLCAIFRQPTDQPDHWHRPLLRPRRERPDRRATESSDEFAPSKANAHLPSLVPWGAIEAE